jgi:hypothetical protein
MKLLNPDMSFCGLILSVSMFVLSSVTFYSQRDFNNEYFARQFFLKNLNNPTG